MATARRALDAGTTCTVDDPQLADLAAWHAAFVLSQEGRFPEALAALESCRAGVRGPRLRVGGGGSALLAAFAHLGRGDTMAGRTACEAAIRVLTPLGDTWALLHAEAALGRVAQAEGRYADAARHHARAVGSADALGFPGAAALHRAHLGRAQHAAGDPAAVATLRQAADEAERGGDLRLLAGTRVALARPCCRTVTATRHGSCWRRPTAGMRRRARVTMPRSPPTCWPDCARRTPHPTTGVHERRSQVP